MKEFRVTRQLMKEVAMTHMGVQYKWGGDDPIAGFDCSGLMVEIMQSVGLMSAHQDLTANGMWENFLPVPHDETPWQVGNLVFYGSDGRASHVGMLIEDYHVITATGGGRAIVNTTDAAAHNAFVKIRPVHYRGDFLGVRFPLFSPVGSYDINQRYAMLAHYSV